MMVENEIISLLVSYSILFGL